MMDGSSAGPSPGLVDAHCHLDLYPDPPALANELHRLGMHVITVTNAPSVFPSTEALVASLPRIHAALGLHPELVKSHGHESARLQELLPRTRFVGEVGLDYTTSDSKERGDQRDLLEQVVEWAAGYENKVLSLHSRRATADVIAIVGNRKAYTAILHWFSGTNRQLEIASQAGFYFSVNIAMTRSAKGRSLIARMPAERVLTESDGPFVREGRGSATPLSVSKVVEHLASEWACEFEDAKSRVLSNFERATAGSSVGPT